MDLGGFLEGGSSWKAPFKELSRGRILNSRTVFFGVPREYGQKGGGGCSANVPHHQGCTLPLDATRKCANENLPQRAHFADDLDRVPLMRSWTTSETEKSLKKASPSRSRRSSYFSNGDRRDSPDAK